MTNSTTNWCYLCGHELPFGPDLCALCEAAITLSEAEVARWQGDDQAQPQGGEAGV